MRFEFQFHNPTHCIGCTSLFHGGQLAACVPSVCGDSTVCVFPYLPWLLRCVATLWIYGQRDASGISLEFHLYFAHFHHLFFNFLLYFNNILDTCKIVNTHNNYSKVQQIQITFLKILKLIIMHKYHRSSCFCKQTTHNIFGSMYGRRCCDPQEKMLLLQKMYF